MNIRTCLYCRIVIAITGFVVLTSIASMKPTLPPAGWAVLVASIMLCWASLLVDHAILIRLDDQASDLALQREIIRLSTAERM